jgi:hypothetical protein
MALTAIGVLAIGYGFIFLPEASWPSVAIPFVLLFMFGLFMSMRRKKQSEV